jgi:RHS repeat-associated protein
LVVGHVRLCAGGTITGRKRYYAIPDANWNVTAVVAQNDSGAWDVVSRYQYNPYGTVKELKKDWSDQTQRLDWRYLHQGGYYNNDLSGDDLYHFRARSYDPYNSRWLQRDPAGYFAGLNLREYENSNPASNGDADETSFLSTVWEHAKQALPVMCPAIGIIQMIKYEAQRFTQAMTFMGEAGYGEGSGIALGAVVVASDITGVSGIDRWHSGYDVLSPDVKLSLGQRWLEGVMGAVQLVGTAFALESLGAYPSGGAQVAGRTAAVADGSTYSVAYEARLSEGTYPGVSRSAHYQQGNEALLSAMERDPAFAQAAQECGINLERTATGLAPRTPPPGWTWHHAQEAGMLQLVPRPQHTAGSIWWDTLHPNGQGGYSIWGK